MATEPSDAEFIGSFASQVQGISIQFQPILRAFLSQ